MSDRDVLVQGRVAFLDGRVGLAMGGVGVAVGGGGETGNSAEARLRTRVVPRFLSLALLRAHRRASREVPRRFSPELAATTRRWRNPSNAGPEGIGSSQQGIEWYEHSGWRVPTACGSDKRIYFAYWMNTGVEVTLGTGSPLKFMSGTMD